MSSLAPWQDIRARVEAAQLVPDDHVSWPNEPFTFPADDLWLAVEATGSTNLPIELGGGCYQEDGTAYIHVYAPAGSGTVDARQVAERAFSAFRNVSGPVVYLGGSIGLGQIEEIEGAWWRLTVSVDWKYQTVLS